MMHKLWSALNSNIAILVFGFLLTGVVGSWLSDRFQEESWHRQAEFEAQRRAFEWERQKTFELLRHRLEEGLHSLEDVSNTMNKRLFIMEKVFNVARRGNTPSPQLWGEYMDAVQDWNIKLKYYEEDLKRLVGENFATEFNDYATDGYADAGHCPASTKDIYSIHGKFWCGHRNLECLTGHGGCSIEDRNTLIQTTAALIRELNYQTDAFVARAGDVFLSRSAELDEFKFIPASDKGKSNNANGS